MLVLILNPKLKFSFYISISNKSKLNLFSPVSVNLSLAIPLVSFANASVTDKLGDVALTF
jgi:hypothetical protein